MFVMKLHKGLARVWGQCLSVGVALFLLAACAAGASLQEKVDGVIRNAELTLASFKTSQEKPLQAFRSEMKNAAGVIILPGVFKGGFIVGGEYGTGVLVARTPGGGWSYPAFYTLGAGSIGLQAGGEISEMIMVIRSPEALDAVLKHQGKLGAELGITVGTVGSGVEAATTANMGVDIMVYSRSVGLFGGGALEGAALVRRNDYNTVYYGEGVTPEAIIMGDMHSNAGAEGLRGSLRDF